ncbi:MAG: FAD-binding oxidoreductase [Gammaproteobacteria bacterium]|nr:FAD-binding oxidoreductase [Gammaproteobacteria bacterium]
MLSQAEFQANALSVLSAHQIKTDPADLATWGTDWTRSFVVDPLAVVFPESVEQVVQIVKKAPEWGVALVPSGGRTGLSGGAVAPNREVVVSLDRMNAILDFLENDKIVHCQAGVITQQLQEVAHQHGLFYPVDFSSSGSSQIGGNIATNAGGIRVIRYGLTRRWVAGLTVVTGTGAVLRLNHGLVKNATGYDLRHLFIGSEGTLGIVVEAEIRLIPTPATQQVMVLAIPQLLDILKVLRVFQDSLELSAFEFFSELALQKVQAHRDLQRPFTRSSPFYALLEYDENEFEQAQQTFAAAVDAGWVADGVVSQSLSQASALWELREGISESIAPYTPYKNDISVRIGEIPEFLADVEKVVAQNYPDLEVVWFGHIGDGNVHLNILRPPNVSIDEFYERCHTISPQLFALIQARNGSISAEHGVGLLKRDFLSYSRSEEEIQAMRQMKRIFDPHNILNPNKLLATSQ